MTFGIRHSHTWADQHHLIQHARKRKTPIIYQCWVYMAGRSGDLLKPHSTSLFGWQPRDPRRARLEACIEASPRRPRFRLIRYFTVLYSLHIRTERPRVVSPPLFFTSCKPMGGGSSSQPCTSPWPDPILPRPARKPDKHGLRARPLPYGSFEAPSPVWRWSQTVSYMSEGAPTGITCDVCSVL